MEKNHNKHKIVNSLAINELNKSFGKNTILNNVSIHCQTGEILGIFGKNGSGKSTWLKCIFGTMKANSITLAINNHPIKPKKVIEEGTIGYLPQDSFLPKEKTERNIIPLFYPDGEDQDKIFYSKGIYNMETRKVGKLSLGELRYLEVLLLAYLDHPFLMLDEPFSMIQPIYKDLIKNLLLGLKDTKGIIVTDHYYRDVLNITDRNILIKDGKTFDVENANDLQHYGYLKT